MAVKGTLLGVAAVLLAGTIVASSFAFLYYIQYQQQSSEIRQYTSQLDSSLKGYESLNSSYQEALRGYNQSIVLLSQAISSLNTSSPAYIVGSHEISALWQSYLRLSGVKAGAITYSMNLLLESGNGTRRWYNDTLIQPGWNAYVVTVVVLNGNVQATWYPQYGEHLVTGLGGLGNDVRQGKSWFLWTWNSTASWQTAEVGADQIPIRNGSVIAWTYCSYNPLTFSPVCKSP